MTRVRVGIKAPTASGADTYLAGRLEWAPTRRRVVGDDVVLPAPFPVELTPAAAPIITVAPTSTSWVWKVSERSVTAGARTPRYLLVPDTDVLLDYADLVEVDPETLDPITDEALAAWDAALAQVAAYSTSAETSSADASASAEEANTAADLAATAALAADQSATDAATSAASATGSAAVAVANAATAVDRAAAAATSATNAATSATNAATSATNAQDSATAASDDATGAQGSASAASTSATNAASSATAAAGSAATAATRATEAATSATAAQAARGDLDTAMVEIQALSDSTVTTGSVVGNDLVLTRSDGTEVVAGYVRGPQGEVGPVGPEALNPRGAYDPAEDYWTHDAVNHPMPDGRMASWLAIVDVPASADEPPAADSPAWFQLAMQGAQGETGSPGPVTTFTASASTLAAGAAATATLSGSAPSYGLALGIPQGVAGAKGDPGDLTPVAASANWSGTQSLASTVGTYPRTLTGNTTLTAPAAGAAGWAYTVTYVIRQAASGGPYTVTWPSTLEWAGDAAAPTMPTVANSELIVHLFWTGAAWRAFVGGVFYP